MNEAIRRTWIGLVEVEPIPWNTIFDGCPGAYSNVLCLACNEIEYRFLVTESLSNLGLTVKEYQDVEPLEQRWQKQGQEYDLPDEILELAAQLSETSPVLYDDFYVYESEIENDG